jgi:hypothetical protein
MATNSDQQLFVDRLGQVKDSIGEWHDWEALVAIAKDALDHGGNCGLIKNLLNVVENECWNGSTVSRNDEAKRSAHKATQEYVETSATSDSLRSLVGDSLTDVQLSFQAEAERAQSMECPIKSASFGFHCALAKDRSLAGNHEFLCLADTF